VSVLQYFSCFYIKKAQKVCFKQLFVQIFLTTYDLPNIGNNLYGWLHYIAFFSLLLFRHKIFRNLNYLYYFTFYMFLVYTYFHLINDNLFFLIFIVFYV